MSQPKLIFVLTSVTLATSFQFGYHTGAINEPLNLISDFIRNNTRSRHGSVDEAYVTTMASLCVSAFLIGGLVGALGSGFLANRVGRKWSIIWLSLPCILGSLLLMICQIANAFELVIIGRLLVGLACGSYTAIAPVYMTEVSPSSIRGAVGVLNQLVVVISLVISQILGLPPLMGTKALWPVLLGFNGIPCLLGTLGLFFCPESPRYLYLIKKNHEAAKCALARLRNNGEEVEAELTKYEFESRTTVQKVSILELFRTPHLRLAALICIVAQAGQQLSGMNGLLYYSVKLFECTGIGTDSAPYVTMGIGGMLLLVTIISLFLIDRLGRRVLLIGGLIDAFFCLIVFTFSMILKQALNARWPAFIAIISSYVFVCGFAIGPGSIPWFLVSEFFSQETRDAALTVATTANWVFNIALGLSFIQLIKYMDIYSFLPFIGIEFVVILTLLIYMPETMGKPVHRIENYFKRLTYAQSATMDAMEDDTSQLVIQIESEPQPSILDTPDIPVV